jgi:outer membrane protein
VSLDAVVFLSLHPGKARPRERSHQFGERSAIVRERHRARAWHTCCWTNARSRQNDATLRGVTLSGSRREARATRLADSSRGGIVREWGIRRLIVAAAVTLSPLHAIAQTTDGAEHARPTSLWFARIGVLDAIYHPSATIATIGQTIPGATATVSDNLTLMFDLGYDVTENFSVQMMGGIPPKPTVTGERTVAALGDLGAVRYGPVFLTGTWRIPRWRGWRPYVGAGAVYAIILDNQDRTVSDLVVRNNVGLVLQGGVERPIANNLELFVDFKEVWLAVDAHGTLAGGVPVTARVTLNPSVVAFGVKFRFR